MAKSNDCRFSLSGLMAVTDSQEERNDYYHRLFVDYGPEYTAFANEGLAGGFYKSELNASQEKGSVLIVFYSKELEKTQVKIELAGGTIIKPVFDFPGGRRFHFVDPNGNEYAVWSDLDSRQNR